MAKQSRQFGTWTSPLSPKSLAGGMRLNDVQWDGDTLVWLEGRGAQGVLVAQRGSEAPRDLTSDLSVRAYVGYGGGDFTVSGGCAYFASAEGRLYRLSLEGGSARPITPAFGAAASPRVSPDGRWLVFVHSYERIDGLAVVDSEGKQWARKLAFGTDFVMQPAWHPQGTHVAYIAWNHPQMPWDGTELRLITLDNDGDLPRAASIETLTGNTTTAIFQPEFSPDGRYLSYISDATGLGQLYLYDLQTHTHTALTDARAEHLIPAWVQGLRTYGWTGDSRAIYHLRNDQGFFSLWRCEIASRKSQRVTALDEYTMMNQPAVAQKREAVAVIGSASTIPPRIVTHELESGDVPMTVTPPETPSIQVVVPDSNGTRIRRRSTTESLTRDQLAQAQAVTWTGHDGESVHGLYYAPTSDRFEGTGTPPLIVHVHGGPTSQDTARYSSEVQFYTSRGFAVLQPNHRGSTGYGKAYMNKLIGNWGVYDVEDSASGAASLAAKGLADPKKLVILGGSAGGYTVLQSLVDKPGFYKAGVCLYGISNQFALVTDTHKFEERYSDSLLGALPEAAERYRSRSPLFHAEKISDPVIIFQGEDDNVVTKIQSDSIVASLKARGVPHEYHVYAGEGHGWRKPETIEHYLNAVVKFLAQYVVYA